MKNWRSWLHEELVKACSHSPEAECRWIIEEIFGRNGAPDELSFERQKQLQALLERRRKHEPLQYIFGNAPFRELTLQVDKRVLIPRPETEELVGWAIGKLPKQGKLLDLGCGSGAILLAVLFERPDCSAIGVDISLAALEVAQANCVKYELSDRVQFRQSDLFSGLAGEKFSLICANLPYISEEEYTKLDAEVRDYEPQTALVASDAGLGLILRTVREASEYLEPNGWVIFELDPKQAERTMRAMGEAGFDEVETILDLCGRKRFVIGKKIRN